MLASHQENAKEESETKEGCTEHGKSQPGEGFRAGINFIILYYWDCSEIGSQSYKYDNNTFNCKTVLLLGTFNTKGIIEIDT